MEQSKQFKSVLILDDDTTLARSLSFELADLGYEIADVTFNGIAAIKAAQKKSPDIALLDIKLEGQDMTGIDVGNEIRSISEEMIIIYMTAYDTDENFKSSLQSAPSAFIKKPYSMGTLNRQIELAINKNMLKKEQTNGVNKNRLVSTKALPKDYRILCLPKALQIKKAGFYENCPIQDIVYIEADNVWSTIHAGGKKNVVSLGLGKMERLLAAYPYPSLLRIHNSYVINLNHIKTFRVTEKSGGEVVLSDGCVLKVPKGYSEKFWQGYLNYFGKSPEE